MNFDFLVKATGIVFRESFEAILIYGIIVSFFNKNEVFKTNIKEARLGFLFGVVASLVMGLAMAQSNQIIPERFFSLVELITVFGGSFFMFYMVFWMSSHAKSMKKDLEGDLTSAIDSKKNYSVFAVVFFSVFREGVETVVYLYSLILENKSIAQLSMVISSLILGVLLSYLIYFFAIKSTQRISLQTVFKITGIWLLFSASSLLASGIDRLFSGDWLTALQEPLFSINFSESGSRVAQLLEGLTGVRFAPSLWHLIAFLAFWSIVILKDPINLKKSKI